MKLIKPFLIIIMTIIICNSLSYAFIVYKYETSNSGIECEIDPYYSYSEFYRAFGAEIPIYDTSNEIYIYKDLFKKSFIPKLILFEISVYPAPYIGTYIKRAHRDIYDTFQINDSLNLIQAITIGFEEPYAFSVFFGNIARFKDTAKKDKAQGKAYMGYLISAGGYHIKSNELIETKWTEFEWKVKGEHKSEIKKMSWSFRIGAKIFQSRDINDTLYISLKRNRVDYNDTVISMFKNSSFEWIYRFESRTYNPESITILFGKSFPFKRSKKSLNLSIGAVWEIGSRYKGSLGWLNDEDKSDFQIIIRPGFQF
ncbi:MAG: hypothetical protein ABH857_00060 [Elusimicrobiota bacterium]